MYLITTINAQECGWEIVASGSKKELELEMNNLIKKVWFNENGTQKMFSDIYDDTRAKNAIIVSEKVAKDKYDIDERAYDYFIEMQFEDLQL